MNDTPTPETDAIHLKQGLTHAEYRRHAQRLQRERDEAREGWADEIQKGQAGLRNAERLYNEAIRERDEARNEIIGWRNKWDCAIDMGARAECNLDEMTLRRNLAISLLDEECALADRLAKGIELFLSQTVSPLAPLKVPLDAWKEARNV